MYKVFNEFSRPNIPKTIRFPEKMSLELGRLSTQHDIFFNRIVLQCCRYALDNLQPKENPSRQ